MEKAGKGGKFGRKSLTRDARLCMKKWGVDRQNPWKKRDGGCLQFDRGREIQNQFYKHEHIKERDKQILGSEVS